MVRENPLDILKKKTNIFDYAANNFSVPEEKEQFSTPIPKQTQKKTIIQPAKIEPTTIQQKTAQDFNIQPQIKNWNIFEPQENFLEKTIRQTKTAVSPLEERQELYRKYGNTSSVVWELSQSFLWELVDTWFSSARGILDTWIQIWTAKVKTYLNLISKKWSQYFQEKIDMLQSIWKDKINAAQESYFNERPRLKELKEKNQQATAIDALDKRDRQTLGNKMFATIWQAFPAIAAWIATKNPALVYATMFPQMKDEVTQDLTNDKSLKLTPSQINTASTIMWWVNTVIETIALETQLKPFMKPLTKQITNAIVKKWVLKEWLIQTLKSMTAESIEEIAQQAVQNLGAKSLWSERDFGTLKEYAKIWIESFILSFGMSVPGWIMQSIQQNTINKIIEEDWWETKATLDEFFDTMSSVAVEEDIELPPSPEQIQESEMEQVDQTKYQTIQSEIPENTRTGIQKYKNAKIEDVIDKLPDINLDKDLVIKDIQWDKFTIKEWTPLTPYQMIWGKVLLQNWTTYIVPNNQFQNLKNQSTELTAKEFAPELRETEETTLWAKDYAKIDLSDDWAYESIPENIRQIVEESEVDWDFSKIQELKAKINAKWWDLDYDMDWEVTSFFKKDEWEPTKYEKYTLPWWKNYKEVLIQAPTVKYTELPKDMIIKKWLLGIYNVISDNWEWWFVGNWWKTESEAIRAALKSLNTYWPWNEKSFRSSHREQPNILAHLRLNEREYNWEKVIFMEELQSDRAREARKNQISQEEIEKNKEMQTKYTEFVKEMRNKYPIDEVVYPRGIWNRELIQRYWTPEELDRFETLLSFTDKGTNSIPNNTLLKNRQTLAIKRALFEAAEKWYKYFSWINGEQTAERYSLEKHIDNINWNPSQIGGKTIKINPISWSEVGITIDKDGTIIWSSQAEWKGKSLWDVIWKWLAEQIMWNEEWKIDWNWLKIWWERAYNMYDKQVPNIVKDLTGQTPIKIDLWYDINWTKTKIQKQQTIELTPEVVRIIKWQAPLRQKPSWKAIEDVFAPALYQLFKKATKQPISKEEALKIVRKYFDANEVSVNFANKISTPQWLLAFGKYVKWAITFIENPDISTPRHEVVHAYLDLFVSPQRKAEIMSNVMKSVAYKDYLDGEKPTLENAEEFLADLGNDYMMKQEIPSNVWQKIINFLKDLIQSIKKFFWKENKMIDLFNDIMNNNRDYIADKFTEDQKFKVSDEMRYFKQISKEWPKFWNVDKYDATKYFKEEWKKSIQDLRSIYETKITKSDFKKMSTKWAKQVLKDIISPISTEIGKIAPELKYKLRRQYSEANKRSISDIENSKEFLELEKKLSAVDYSDLTFALFNGDKEKTQEILKDYNVELPRKVLDWVYQRAEEQWFDIWYEKDYFPRVVKDPAGLLEALQRKDESWFIKRAIKEKEMSIGRVLTVEEKAAVANSMLRWFWTQNIIIWSKNFKQRGIDVVTKDLIPYYYEPFQWLLRYLEWVNDAIEMKKFFGWENPNDSIGAVTMKLLEDWKITPEQELQLKELLLARFNKWVMNWWLSAYRDLSYMVTMGNPMSAITQIGDLAWAMYKNWWIRGTKSLFSKKNITKEDIGINEIAREFSDGWKLQKALNKIFSTVWIWWMDKLGKETFINSSFDKYVSQSKKDPKWLEKDLQEKWFPQEAINTIINDLQNKTVSEDVKFLLFNDLADFQPIWPTEMPKAYLMNPNARIMYMLKTFTIKQLDVIRREIYDQIKKDPKKWLKNLVSLAGALMIFNGTADILKNLLLWRDFERPDMILDNIIRLFWFSKYQVYKAKTEWIVPFLQSVFLPPTSLIDYPIKDIVKATSSAKWLEFSRAKSFQLIPYVWKLYYRWFGWWSPEEKKSTSLKKKTSLKTSSSSLKKKSSLKK